MDATDDNLSEEKPDSPICPPLRNPAFSLEEVNLIVNLVEKHKTVILNRSTNAASSHAKDAAWIKITEEFNAKNLKYKRSTDSLKVKWDNLKKTGRKMSRNILETNCYDNYDVARRIVTLLYTTETNNISQFDVLENENIENTDSKQESDVTENEEQWNSYSNNKTSDTTDVAENGDNEEINCNWINRTLNFAPQESRLLLQCVKLDKKHVLSKDTSTKGLQLKNQAWKRITEEFNKKNYVKRSSKVLRTKFSNMKKQARIMSKQGRLHRNKYSNKKQTSVDIFLKEVKQESPFHNYNDLENDQSDNHNDFTTDPLNKVLNSHELENSTHSNISNCDTNFSNNEDVIKLKVELLNYKLETAKLERQRLNAAIAAETSEQESRALETALRLRAARLEAVAAEMRLPAEHPALQYPPNEARTQHYINMYTSTRVNIDGLIK